ncbi:MAG: response regulator transcription factor [Verrucomicrobiales bacterium]|nr:response regulator transcription factor [Verrucomicrobiales bacterium]
MKALRIFLAEDQTILRQSLKSLIEDYPDLRVVGEAADGEEAVRLVKSLHPDIVVMDISMPRTDGIQAAAAIKQACPEVKVLVLTVHETKSHIRRALQAGASGYVVKRSAAEELIQALRAVAAEGVYLDPIVAMKLIPNTKTPASVKVQQESLSDREAEVVRLIALGYANKEIAARLNLSVKTVETFKMRSTEKLGLRSRVEIVRYALDQGWLTPNGEGN